MLKQIKRTLNAIIEKGYTLNPWTNVYGLARSFLALSLLITLLFTGYESLFPTNDGVLLRQAFFNFEKISIFYLLKDNIFLAWSISVFILIFVISGYFPQISGILHWWITFSYMISGIIIEGSDQIASILTLLLIPISITDNRSNHWHRAKDCNRKKMKFFAWSFYTVIIFQVSIIYFHAGVAKLSVDEWLNGTAVYYWFTHSIFGVSGEMKNAMAYLLSSPIVVGSIAWGTMMLEILLFGWIFMKRSEWNWKLLFILGVLFHVSIAFIHGLVSFMFTMIGALILYFYPKSIGLNFNKWN